MSKSKSSPDQMKIKQLLKLELSSPVFYPGLFSSRTEERIEWILPNGDLHREFGPALELADGSKVWYLNGVRHRECGPAAEYTCGFMEWYTNGKLHREDGPAIICRDGNEGYFINGKMFSKEGYDRWNINNK
jgi:hypothetical protein